VSEDDHPAVRLDSARIRWTRAHGDQDFVCRNSSVSGEAIDEKRMRILELGPAAQNLHIIPGESILDAFRLALNHPIDLRK
jgi:hypothetical protein